MAKESRFIIVQKLAGESEKFLKHTGHKHHFTRDRSLAMEYTRLDVAQELARVHGGAVVPI